MINVREDVNTNTSIVSLNKALKLARVYGEIKVNDLYLLNTIYALLNTMCLELTNKQRRKLISTYNTLAFKSNDICTDVMLKAFQQPMTSRYSKKYVNPEDIHKNININYWKAPMYSTNEDVINMLNRSFLNEQYSKTRELFDNGSNTSVQGIGKICLFINSLSNTNIHIKDILDNDVTHSFDIGYIPSLNGVLIISDNMYNSEQLILKINING